MDGEFILYDIQKEDGTFWSREAVANVSEKLGMKMPWETDMTIQEAIDFVKTRPASKLNPENKMEGLVLRAPIELYTSNNHERVICKVKVKDFVDIKDYRNE